MTKHDPGPRPATLSETSGVMTEGEMLWRAGQMSVDHPKTEPSAEAIERAHSVCFRLMGSEFIPYRGKELQRRVAAFVEREREAVREECAKWHIEQAATCKAKEHLYLGSDIETAVIYGRETQMHLKSAAAFRAAEPVKA